MEGLMSNLLPDEDALGQRRDPRGVIKNMAEGDVGFFSNVLFWSLYQHGTVAHRGTIPLHAIRRVAYIPYSSRLWLGVTTWMDTTVRSAIRAQQGAILRWVFDGSDNPFPVPAEELVFNPNIATQLAGIPAGDQEKADGLQSKGVSADTLWRMHLMANPEFLNREAIEVVQVSTDTTDADVWPAAAAA
jgi:hypothetical protein